jgi:hypothetical protein
MAVMYASVTASLSPQHPESEGDVPLGHLYIHACLAYATNPAHESVWKTGKPQCGPSWTRVSPVILTSIDWIEPRRLGR